MRKFILIFLLVFSIAACEPVARSPQSTPDTKKIQTPIVLEEEMVMPTPLSFVSQTFSDSEGKFSIQYPDSWTINPEQVIGDRGSQTLLLSPGSTAEALAIDGSRIVFVKYLWDPKNDLAAWVTQRKLAWEASGFNIEEENTRQLESGRTAVDFLVQTPDRIEILFTLTTINDRYLEISAQGNLELCREILGTLTLID